MSRSIEPAPVRVLLCEDSEIAAKFIRRALAEDPRIHVVTAVQTGTEVLAKKAGHDVLIVDLLTPGESGLSVLPQLASTHPVIAISDQAADSALAKEALSRGASAFFPKQALRDPVPGEMSLCEKVRDLARVYRKVDDFAVVAIVGSTGAVEVGARILEQIEPGGAIVLLQHFPESRGDTYVQWLRSRSIDAIAVTSGVQLRPGAVWCAVGGQQVEFRKHETFGTSLRCTNQELVDGHCPSASVLIGSGEVLGARLLSVVLSGMGNDGARGVARSLRSGARCVVQRPASCVAPSMPESAALQSSLVRVGEEEQLVRWINQHVQARFRARL